MTALIWAARKGHTEIAELLVRNADLNCKDRVRINAKTYLHAYIYTYPYIYDCTTY